MELHAKNIRVAITEITGEKITLFFKRPTNADRIDWRTQTQQIRLAKGKKLVNDGMKNRLPIAKRMLVGIEAPRKTAGGEYVDGYTWDGQPLFCNPDTGECNPDTWRDIVLEAAGHIVELGAGHIFDGSGIEDADADDDDDEDSGEGEPKNAV